MRPAKHMAVGLICQAVLAGPLIKQCRIALELQQERSNFFRPRHTFVRRIKASFVISIFGVFRISLPSDISITQIESRLADIEGIMIVRLRSTGESNDVVQVLFRATTSTD